MSFGPVAGLVKMTAKEKVSGDNFNVLSTLREASGSFCAKNATGGRGQTQLARIFFFLGSF